MDYCDKRRILCMKEFFSSRARAWRMLATYGNTYVVEPTVLFNLEGIKGIMILRYPLRMMLDDVIRTCIAAHAIQRIPWLPSSGSIFLYRIYVG